MMMFYTILYIYSTIYFVFISLSLCLITISTTRSTSTHSCEQDMTSRRTPNKVNAGSPVDGSKTEEPKPLKTNEFVKNYQQMLVEHKFAMNVLQGGIITALGVAASSYLSKGVIDFVEIKTMATLSSIYIVPTLTLFYGEFLDKLKISKIDKLVVDQLLWSPIFTTSIITLRIIISCCFHGTTADLSIDNLFAEVLNSAPNVVLAAWGFWIPFRFLTLTFAPIHLHVLIGSVGNFFWTIVLTFLLSKK